MLHRIREQIGTAGLIVAIVALVAALAGGAYAASQTATSSKAKPLTKAQVLALIKANAASGPQGAPGAAGPAGANGKDGANGTNGAPGTNGTDGTDGDDGEPGEDGQNGVSVNSVTEPTSTANCSGRGGSKFTAAGNSVTYACNGAKGDTGDPWTASGTLPPGATQTGAWIAKSEPADFDSEFQNLPTWVPISFPVPLAAPLAYDEDTVDSHVHAITTGGLEVKEEGGVVVDFMQPEHCPGSAADPEADPGHLCIYAAHEDEINFFNMIVGADIFRADSPALDPEGGVVRGASTAGALFRVLVNWQSSESGSAYGTWAVTAP
jgi:Collagen triple helix repeat (20 copies)